MRYDDSDPAQVEVYERLRGAVEACFKDGITSLEDITASVTQIGSKMWGEEATHSLIDDLHLETEERLNPPKAVTVKKTVTTSKETVTTTTDGGDWIEHPEMPGYASDEHLRLKDIAGGKGRRKGHILALQQGWAKNRKAGKSYWFLGYQITKGGKRPRVSLIQISKIRRDLKWARDNHKPYKPRYLAKVQ